MRIILASSSPRRKELMKFLNVAFEVIHEEVDESIDINKNIYNECMRLAYMKAKKVYDEIKDDVMVIGSDTVVFYHGKVFGKPKDKSDAYKMIRELSGMKHEVISSICVLIRKDGKETQEVTYDKCMVYVSKMNELEIKDWIENNDVTTRAGAYAIQDGFCKYIERIDGDYFSIVGLPVRKLYEIIRKQDFYK